jgi:glutathione S-transferase
MKLYYLKGACSLASHIALYESGLPFEVASLDRATRITSDGKEFDKLNPKGYVPVLLLDNGEVITENVAVLQYVADLVPAKKLAPTAGTMERTRLQEWLAFINSEVHKSFSPLFNPAAPAEAKDYTKINLTRRLDWLESSWGSRAFLMGEQFTVADAYLYTVFGWLKGGGLDPDKWPTLKRYHERVGARPAVQQARKAEGLH